ncbi:MAG: TetR/AcrR family transcriptional regulator [Spirochaetes bacterium]|nr:TetR/AcrR family transcriptional regulator [Spirochaetota bacterium]
MGRPFNEKEKEAIKKALLKKGKALFSRSGLKKTSVGELTQAAGIAQGSLYAFFDSKEELYFEILEAEEKRISAVVEKDLYSIEMTRSGFKRFLTRTVALITENPIVAKMFDDDEYRILISKIPEDKFRKHLHEEYTFTKRLVGMFQERQHMKKIKPEILSGLLYAMFLLQLHRNEMGGKVFPELFEFLIDMISDTLINKGKRNLDEAGEKYSQ